LCRKRQRIDKEARPSAQLLHRTGRRHPGKAARTYAEFDASCSRLATGLHANDIAKGTHVAVLAIHP